MKTWSLLSQITKNTSIMGGTIRLLDSQPWKRTVIWRCFISVFQSLKSYSTIFITSNLISLVSFIHLPCYSPTTFPEFFRFPLARQLLVLFFRYGNVQLELFFATVLIDLKLLLSRADAISFWNHTNAVFLFFFQECIQNFCQLCSVDTNHNVSHNRVQHQRRLPPAIHICQQMVKVVVRQRRHSSLPTSHTHCQQLATPSCWMTAN